jgi:transposase
MEIRLHKNARTTPAIRAELQQSKLSDRQLAKRFNISRTTARKWKNRSSVEDKSHRPDHIQSSLSE